MSSYVPPTTPAATREARVVRPRPEFVETEITTRTDEEHAHG